MCAYESECSTGLFPHDVAQRRGAAHIVDSADLQAIRRVGENQRDLRLGSVDTLRRPLPRCFTHGHPVEVVLLFGGKLTQKGSFSS